MLTPITVPTWAGLQYHTSPVEATFWRMVYALPEDSKNRGILKVEEVLEIILSKQASYIVPSFIISGR